MARRTFFLIRLLLPAVLLVAFYWICVSFLSHKGVPVPQSTVQLYFFPFVVCYLVYLLQFICQIPNKLLLLVIICGVVFTGFSKSSTITSPNQVMFATLKGDKLASKSRLIKLEFESALGKNKKNNALSIYDKVDNKESAEAILRKNPNAVGLVWGDNKNLRITISDSAKYTTSSSANWLYELTNYKIITHIPFFSAGLEPLPQTIKVITASLLGDQLDMLVASRIVTKWRTTAARSFLFFRIGNSYLLDSLDSKSYQYASLDCAVDFYYKALKILRPSDSPELRRAIFNNLSFALLIRGSAENNKEDLRKSRQYILLATREPKKKSAKISSILLARENAKVVSLFSKSGGLKRKIK